MGRISLIWEIIQIDTDCFLSQNSGVRIGWKIHLRFYTLAVFVWQVSPTLFDFLTLLQVIKIFCCKSFQNLGWLKPRCLQLVNFFVLFSNCVRAANVSSSWSGSGQPWSGTRTAWWLSLVQPWRGTRTAWWLSASSATAQATSGWRCLKEKLLKAVGSYDIISLIIS